MIKYNKYMIPEYLDIKLNIIFNFSNNINYLNIII